MDKLSLFLIIENYKKEGKTTTEIYNILVDENSFEIAEKAKEYGFLGKNLDGTKEYEVSGAGIVLIFAGLVGMLISPNPLAGLCLSFLGVIVCVLFHLFPNNRSAQQIPIKIKF